MTRLDSESVPFHSCPKIVSMIGAQILPVVQNKIPHASNICGSIFCIYGTMVLYFALSDKTYAVPITFHSLGHTNRVIIYGPNSRGYVFVLPLLLIA